MTKTCPNCQQTFSAKLSRQQYCSDACRMRAGYLKRTNQAPSLTVLPPAIAEAGTANLFSVVQSELAKAGRDATPIGMLCLVLARQISDGVDSPSGLAQLSKELAARLADALANVEVVLSPVDELRAKREARSAR